MMTRLYNKFRDIFAAEQERLILWAPVCIGVGAGWYFHQHHEPPATLGAGLLLLSVALAFRLRRFGWPKYIAIALALAASGIVISQIRTDHVRSLRLEGAMTAWVTGTLAEIAPTPKGTKLLLEKVTIEGVAQDKTPLRVSLSLRQNNVGLREGQKVSLRAGLYPPPPASMPDGFDFGRHFYFRQIGAVGYAMPPVEVLPGDDTSESVRFSEFRRRLTQAIASHFDGPAGPVSAAFITGETRNIPDAVNDEMRVSGLYHLLAVSGMNLSIVAGMAFFSLRFLLAAIPFLALRYPIKKWAAALALIVSYVYLMVAGSPVSAERAFLMVALIFIAILIDRDPAPMRSLAISSLFIIIHAPEAVLTASFQLSFSATAALIASYEWGIKRMQKRSGIGLHLIGFYLAAVLMTSFVAWLATSPFIIYHFNQFSTYSLLANTLVDPLVSFVLMPLVVAGVLLMPLGLGGLAFTPMQYGVDWLLAVSHKISALPYAMIIMPSPTDAGMVIASFGIIWIYFWKTSWRWLGLIALLLGVSTSLQYVSPDVFISTDGKHVAAKLEDGRMVMIQGRAQNFGAQQWVKAGGQIEYADKDITPLECDKTGCVIKIKGRMIAVPKKTEAMDEDCRIADIVITKEALAKDTCAAAVVIDKAVLEAGGATALWLGDTIIMRQVKPEQGNRPWTVQKVQEEAP